ncbi:MAG: HAMP domain-containing sensor histidine kinase [Myxococcota bacterium]|jgi:hypothetical protein|nr:HAMP domain-containing sensor histidine kinase [Myxococcota bacterium]
MRAIRGVQFEVLASLTLVMVTATGLLAAFMVRTQAIQLDQLRGLIGRALVAEANGPAFRFVGSSGPTQWWLEEAGRLHAVGMQPDVDTTPLLEIAAKARASEEPVVGVGRPWEPLRFAVPMQDAAGSREIAVGRVPPAVSGEGLFALVIADCAIFIAMGAYLLRRRVLVPLTQLSEAARAIGDGCSGTRVEVDGAREAVAVAHAFNEMSEALELRSAELEKAIHELRDSNRSLRAARDGLDRAERLASVGSLAAGVAHEVGNPMGAMLAFLDLARRSEGLDETTVGYLDRASEQGARVREILRQLLDFSRPPRSERKAVDLSAMAEQSIGLVAAQRRYRDVAFSFEADGVVPDALADESIVAQILLNLVINASDAALEAGGAPRVALRVRPAPMTVRVDDEATGVAQRRRVMDGVECEVSDNGHGVAEADRERIFDPFYTTKDPGQGTGLGLANAMQLAEQLGGVVELLEQGWLPGAVFVLRLPTAASDGAGDPVAGAARTSRESRIP